MSHDFALTHFPLRLDGIPTGWCYVSTGEVLEDIQTGFACGRGKQVDDGVPHLRPMNVSPAGDIDLSDIRCVPPDVSDRRLRPGDVLFNNTNSPAWVGKTAFVGAEWTDYELAFSNHMTRLRAHPEAMDPAFLAHQLHYLCQRGYFLHQCKKHVNQASISRTFLGESVPVVVPPHNEQRRIVSKLDALFSHSRKAKQALEAIPPLLERYRQSVLAAACSGRLTEDWRRQNPDVEPAEKLLERIRIERRKRWEEDYLAKQAAKGKAPKNDKWKAKYKEPEPVDTEGLPELPAGWCWARTDELADVGTGATPRRGNPRFWEGGTIPWVTSGATNQNTITEPSELVTAAALTETNLSLYPPGTLLIAMYGEGKTRGKCSELRIEATTNQALASVCVSGKAAECQPYLKLFFQKNYEDIRMISSGGVQPNLNLSRIKGIHVPLPPLAEQTAILGRARAVSSGEAEFSTAQEVVCSRLEDLSASVLAAAFQGRLVPQDPEDEPASVLLERIRAERAAQMPKKKAWRKKKAT